MLAMEQLLPLLVDAGLGEAGKAVFVYKMPDTARQGLVLLNRLSGGDIDWYLPGFQQDGFQLIVRDPSIPNGRAVVSRAVAALTWQQPRTLPATAGVAAVMLRYCRPRHQPIIFPRSQSDLTEFSVNFDYLAVPG